MKSKKLIKKLHSLMRGMSVRIRIDGNSSPRATYDKNYSDYHSSPLEKNTKGMAITI